jgi:hypothetical protein
MIRSNNVVAIEGKHNQLCSIESLISFEHNRYPDEPNGAGVARFSALDCFSIECLSLVLSFNTFDSTENIE